MGQVFLVSIQGRVNEIDAFIAAIVAPTGCSDQRLNLKLIRMHQQPHHRFHVIRLNIIGGNVGQHDDAGLQRLVFCCRK